jgi:hypothetical protein
MSNPTVTKAPNRYSNTMAHHLKSLTSPNIGYAERKEEDGYSDKEGV